MFAPARRFARFASPWRVLAAVAVLVPAAAAAAGSGGGPVVYEAHRIQGDVRIDGVLDDAAWSGPGNGGFFQNEPDNGRPPCRATRWWIAYDDDALYAAFRLEDPAADSIDASVARRDADLDTDCIILELDTYNDDRNGYVFLVGAGGYVYDGIEFNDGVDDPTWDGVWKSATRVDATGWSAELRIPFSQLRFPATDEQVWGINVSRRCKRNQGRDDLFARARNESGHIRRFPDLVGISGLRRAANRQLLPYVVGKGDYLQHDPDDPFNDGSELAGNAGADLKWGLSSNVTLNATVNPDFGQVEVDPAVVNLSDVETYFEEKRPFFVQESNLFRFGRDGTNNNWNFNWMDAMPFYSRRVGRSPQLGADGDADYVRTPSGTTILGAVKATGTVGSTQIGALGAVTARERHELALGGVRRDQLAEPLSGYTAIRVNRMSSDATRAVGAMVTGVERDLSDPQSRETLVRHAWTAGVDGWTYLDADAAWAIRGYLSGSVIRGDAAAIDLQQTSSRRYFQRPDADHVDYDPTRTSLSGWTSRVLLNREKGNLTLNTGLGAVSPGYETNDLGFQTRADYVNGHLAVGPRWTEPKGPFRSRSLTFTTYWTWDFAGTRTGGGSGVFYYADFANYWSVNGHVFYNPPSDNTRATRGGPILRNPLNREFSLEAATDSRSWYRFSLYGGASESGVGDQNAWIGGDATLKPTPAVQVTVGPSLSWTRDEAQYVTTLDDPASATFGKRYIFADIDYRELAMSARVDWAVTPRFTLQGYFQPLLAVGDYSRLKEFSVPGGYGFNVYGETGTSTVAQDPVTREYAITPGDGGAPFTLSDPDFNFKSLRLNVVLRWEYRPGSTFFLVWTRNGVDEAHPGDLNVRRDLDALLGAPSDDVLLVKVTRWFEI